MWLFLLIGQGSFNKCDMKVFVVSTKSFKSPKFQRNSNITSKASSTMANSAIVNTLNTFLDPKLHQVVGSTPESLKVSVQQAALDSKPQLGMKFIALSVFACTVNKPTVETFFIEEKFNDLRPLASRAFVLNGKVNMTALSLAGHCFMTLDELSGVNYIAEMRKKIGQNSIWDGTLAGGSLSEKQRSIFKEKAAVHSKAEANTFAVWFLEYTGIKSLMSSSSATAKGKEPAARVARGMESLGVAAARILSPGRTAALGYEIPDDVEDYYFTELGKQQSDLDALIAQHGVSEAFDRIRIDRERKKKRAGRAAAGAESVIS
jgi:hypothetical protein